MPRTSPVDTGRADGFTSIMQPMRSVALAFLLCLAGMAAYADQIAYEGFDYKSGPITDRDGGEGWDGPWFVSPLNKSDNAVSDGGLEHDGLAVAGNKCLQPGGDIRSFRRIATSRPALAKVVDEVDGRKVLGKDGTTIWISFLISCDSFPTTAYGGIHLCDGVGDLTKDKFGDKRAHQRIQLGRQNIDKNWILCRVTNGGPGAGTWPSKTVADKTVRLLVYRFDFKKGPEEGWMWIDPAVGKEPSTDDADIHAESITDFRFDTINIGAGGSAKFLLDEIRIGTTYADVTPPAAAASRPAATASQPASQSARAR